MKKKWIILVCAGISIISACNSGAKKAASNNTETIEAIELEDSVSDLVFIKEWVGKYPKEVDLLNQPVLNTRLKALLGNQYNDFIANWNTETPITIEGDVIHTSGCKKDECSADSYDLYIDIPSDNINVYNMQKKAVKVYTEKDSISLPEKLKKELHVILSNAKFMPIELEQAAASGL